LSQFTTNFKGELIGKNKWKNLEQFEYHIGTYPSEEIIGVPVGYITNFASVPRIFWALISPIDRHAKAAVIHDYLYDFPGSYNRKKCDEIFLESLIVLDIKPWKKYSLFYGVRLFSWYRWWQLRKGVI
jgi:hypothetical protein